MKPLSELTIDEAEAYRRGYADALLECGYRLKESEPAGELGFPQCRSKNPSEMCPKCNCWKMTRELCS